VYHAEDRKYKCLHCKSTFKADTDLNLHAGTLHKDVHMKKPPGKFIGMGVFDTVYCHSDIPSDMRLELGVYGKYYTVPTYIMTFYYDDCIAKFTLTYDGQKAANFKFAEGNKAFTEKLGEHAMSFEQSKEVDDMHQPFIRWTMDLTLDNKHIDCRGYAKNRWYEDPQPLSIYEESRLDLRKSLIVKWKKVPKHRLQALAEGTTQNKRQKLA